MSRYRVNFGSFIRLREERRGRKRMQPQWDGCRLSVCPLLLRNVMRVNAAGRGNGRQGHKTAH